MLIFLLLLLVGIAVIHKEKGGVGRKSRPRLQDLIRKLDNEDGEEQRMEQDEVDEQQQQLEEEEVFECGCRRRKIIQDGENDDLGDKSGTTCGETAFKRGKGQKVLAYTFFSGVGDGKRRYLDGIQMNAEAASRLYPEWFIRVYHNETDVAKLCRIACSNSNVDLCQVAETPMLGDVRWVMPTLWRFLPLADEQVAEAAFRDADSLLSAREAAAVAEWRRSKHPVHVMRDHPSHDMRMLAGMWGAKVAQVRNTWRKVLLAMLRDPGARPPHELKEGSDQFLLSYYVWPWASGRSMQHDSYTCHLFGGRASPWPTRREGGVGNFVGAPFALAASVKELCPERCRPREHKEWTKC